MTQKEIEHPKYTGHGEGSSDTEAFLNALSDLYANIENINRQQSEAQEVEA